MCLFSGWRLLHSGSYCNHTHTHARWKCSSRTHKRGLSNVCWRRAATSHPKIQKQIKWDYFETSPLQSQRWKDLCLVEILLPWHQCPPSNPLASLLHVPCLGGITQQSARCSSCWAPAMFPLTTCKSLIYTVPHHHSHRLFYDFCTTGDYDVTDRD